MMPGAWLERIGRRMLHQETFELMLSPAIADLQFESPEAGVVEAVRSYASVGAAFRGALLQDFGTDTFTLLDDVPMLSGLIVIQTCYYSSILLLLTTGMSAEQLVSGFSEGLGAAALGVVLGVLSASTGLTLFCFWPDRRVQTPDT